MVGIKQRGCIYTLMALNKRMNLNKTWVAYDTLAKYLGVNIARTDKKNAKVRKILNELYPLVKYEIDSNNLLHIMEVPNYEDLTGNFTQIPCNLLRVEGVTPDLIALWVTLNCYDYGNRNKINPSYETLMEVLGISDKTLTKLIKEGVTKGLWKYDNERKGKLKSSNNYKLAYMKGNKLIYYFTENLVTLQQQNGNEEKGDLKFNKSKNDHKQDNKFKNREYDSYDIENEKSCIGVW